MKQMSMEFKPSTIKNYQSQVKKWVHPHWAQTEITQLTKSDVHELIFDKCAAIVTPNNRRTVFTLIRTLFERAVEEGLINRNPCSGIRVHVPEVEQKVLTTSEAEKFLTEAKLTNHRYYPIWAMALMTGMRSGELYALEWRSVDLESRIISVSRQWSNKNGFGPTKSRRTRVVPISEDLETFLKELKLERGHEDSVLPRHQEWSDGSQADVTRQFCKAIGVTQVKFHDLRATFITNLLARGVSLARVMSIVGHTQLKTTNGYLRRAGVDVQGATESLGYRLPQTSSAGILSLLRP